MRPSPSLLAQIGRLATPPKPVLEAAPSETKVRDFFREVCRFMPWIVKNYRLDELTTAAELRANVAALFKQRGTIGDPRVVDILIYKGREELESIALQHKQRHHLITEYVEGPRAAAAAAAGVAAARARGGESEWLASFYANTQ